MATHSSILAWRIPGTVEPGGLLSMQSRMDRSDLAAAAALHIIHSRLSLSSVNHPQIQPTTYDVQFSSVAQ